MRSEEEVSFVLELVRAGWNDCEIARETGIPQGSRQGLEDRADSRLRASVGHLPVCSRKVHGLPLPDIRGIFGRACDRLGIEWRTNNPWSLSVVRRGSVVLLDGFVGPRW